MQEPELADGGHAAAALVLAQRGTPDSRTLQALDPLITLQELHAKLWVSSTGSSSAKQQVRVAHCAPPAFEHTTPQHHPGPRVGLLLPTQGSTLSISLPGTVSTAGGKGKPWVSRQTSATSRRSGRSASGAGAARPFTSTSKQQVPRHVNPMLWAAALQQEALQGQTGAQLQFVAMARPHVPLPH